IAICVITGVLSDVAYNPAIGGNSVNAHAIRFLTFHWPTHPAWLYAANQGLHVVSGLAAIPLLLAKLWAVIPKLWEWPPLRPLALFAPHGRTPGGGPNGFQINKTARAVGISPSDTGPAWRLLVSGPGGRPLHLSREDLVAMAQATETLPIACVEGWSTTQRW